MIGIFNHFAFGSSIVPFSFIAFEFATGLAELGLLITTLNGNMSSIKYEIFQKRVSRWNCPEQSCRYINHSDIYSCYQESIKQGLQ
tara:strand:+ start:2389 stop:2646 length:258 start_codon:yes stop_codon:yes gene_type:complete